MTLAGRCAGEALGTGLLFATVIGSGIMAERLAGGNVGVALLGNTLATMAMLAMLITALGPVSGAQFNPLVTLVLRLNREIGGRDALALVAAQLAGGLAGVLLAHAMYELPLWQVGRQARTGPGQWLSEGVASFALIFAILACRRSRPDLLPVMVPATIAAGIWFTASTNFANPAITLVRSLTDTFTAIRPVDVPAFVVAQLAGGVAALALARALGLSQPPD